MSISYVPYVRKLKKTLNRVFCSKIKKRFECTTEHAWFFKNKKSGAFLVVLLAASGVTEASHEKRTSVSRKRVQELQKR